MLCTLSVIKSNNKRGGEGCLDNAISQNGNLETPLPDRVVESQKLRFKNQDLAQVTSNLKKPAGMKCQADSSYFRDSTSLMGGNGAEFGACRDCTRFCRSQHSRKSDHQSPSVSRFVKILFGDDWDTILLLPPAFAPTVEDLVGTEMEIENAVGERWTVKLLTYHNGRIGFLEGWKEFAMDHRLVVGDFLAFNYIRGSSLSVHIYGHSLCEKNRNGSYSKNHYKGSASAQRKPCDRKDSSRRSLQSRFVASGSKSGPSVPRGVFRSSSSAHRAQHSRGDHSMLHSPNKRSYSEERERSLGYGSRKHTDKGMFAHDKYQVETENLKLNRTRKVTSSSLSGRDHAYMGCIDEDREEDCIWAEKAMSKTFAKETQVRMPEKDRPSVCRDDSTHRHGNKTSTSLSSGFKLPGEEPREKGNDRSSLREDEGAVLPSSGYICTGDFNKVVINELPERSEPGHYNAKRKIGSDQNFPWVDEGTVFPSSWNNRCTGDLKKAVINELPERSEPGPYNAKRKIGSYSGCSNANLDLPSHGITVMKQVKPEPCDTDAYSSELGIVTCSAVTSGERLELPDKLPALRYLKRGGKAIFLLDRKSKMWPALYEERSGSQVLICDWEQFNTDNEIEAGDNYVLTVEDAVQFLYRINVIRPA